MDVEKKHRARQITHAVIFSATPWTPRHIACAYTITSNMPVIERDEQDKDLPMPWYRYFTDEGIEVSPAPLVTV